MSEARGTELPDIGSLDREYAVVGELGRGGMGSVILARHRFLGRQVAIKISTRGAPADAESMGRIAREAKLLAAVRHPNIVRLYDVADIGRNRLAIVMEYVRGVSLAHLLAQTPHLPLIQCETVLRDLVSALAHAHRCGVVHRDVKPQNVLVQTEAWVAKLCDFGIAKGGREEGDLTATGFVVGTPAYMSPEQIDGKTLDGRSDLYSLGLLGWELLAGRRPWGGVPLFDVLYHQKHSALPPLERMRPDAPSSIVLALEGALGKAPDERWRSADDMMEQLDSSEPTAALVALREGRQTVVLPIVLPDVEPEAATTIMESGADATGVSSERSTPAIPFAAWTGEEEASTIAVPPRGGDPSLEEVAAGAAAPEEDSPDRWSRERLVRAVALVSLGAVLGGSVVYSAALWSLDDRTANALSAVRSGMEGVQSLRVPLEVTTPVERPVTDTFVAAPDERTSIRNSSEARAPSPVMPGVVDEAVLTRLVASARAELRAGRLAPAGVTADSGLTLDPRNGELYAVRARVLAARGAVRDAWTDIELASRYGAGWEVLPLQVSLLAQRDGEIAARQRLLPEVRAATVPRRMLEPSRAFGLAGALLTVGDTITALAILEQTRAPDLSSVARLEEAPFSALRAHPRVDALRRRLLGAP